MATEEAMRQAQVVAADMLLQAAATGAAPLTDESRSIIEEVFSQPDAPAPTVGVLTRREQPSGAPGPAGVESQAGASAPPALPDEIAALLEDDGFDEPDDVYQPEPAAAVPTEQWGYDQGAYEDEEKVRLRAELARAKQQGEKLRRDQARASIGRGLKEAAEFFPYADQEALKQASSRREVLRLARDQHQRVAKVVERERDRLTAEAQAEARAKAEAAWGRPQEGPSAAGSATVTGYDEELQKARRSGDLARVFKTMITGGRG